MNWGRCWLRLMVTSVSSSSGWVAPMLVSCCFGSLDCPPGPRRNRFQASLRCAKMPCDPRSVSSRLGACGFAVRLVDGLPIDPIKSFTAAQGGFAFRFARKTVEDR